MLSECSRFFFEITFMIFPNFEIADGKKEVAKNCAILIACVGVGRKRSKLKISIPKPKLIFAKSK